MRSRVVLAARLLLAALGLAANSVRAEPETLQDAWRIALAADPAFAAVGARTDAAAATERAARAARWPTVALGTSIQRYEHAPALSLDMGATKLQSPPIFPDDRFTSRYAEMNWPLFAGGSISAAIRAATAEHRAATAETTASAADLKIGVAEVYIGVLRARRALAAAEASVVALESHVHDVTAMVETGERARSDLLASRVALAASRELEVTARNGAALAAAQYNRKLGRDLDAPVDLADRVLVPTVTDRDDLSALQAEAVRNRPELAALGAHADSLHARSRAALGGVLPQVAVTAGYQYLDTTILDRKDYRTVGVGLRWTVFDGGAARNQAAALRRAGRAVTLQRDDLESAVRLEVRRSTSAVHEAEARVALSRDALEEASENLRLSRELYAVEAATNTQVLEAAALLKAATNRADDAVLDAAFARLRVLHATGSL